MNDDSKTPPGAMPKKTDQIAALQAQIDEIKAKFDADADFQRRVVSMLEQIDAKLDFVLPDATRVLSLPEIQEYLKAEPDAEFEVASDFIRGDYNFPKGKKLRAAGMPRLMSLVGSGLQLVIPLDRSEATAKLRAANKAKFALIVAKGHVSNLEAKKAAVERLEAEAAAAQAEVESEAQHAKAAIERAEKAAG